MQNTKELNCCTLINIPQLKRGASPRAQRGPLGGCIGWRRATRHLITQGRWEIQLGSVDNILLRLSCLSWLLPIYPPRRLAASQSVPINIQSFAPCFRVSISGTIQDQKKARGGTLDFLPYCTFSSSAFIQSKSHSYKSVGDGGSLPNSSYQREDSAEAG